VLTYVADVFGHTLVAPPFFLVEKIRYNGGSFFVKHESFLNQSQRQDILEKQCLSLAEQRCVNLAERYSPAPGWPAGVFRILRGRPRLI
jgi:hypothetical protein